MATSVFPKLYKQLLRECTKFSDYNFRSHALRRAQHVYEKYLNENDETKLNTINLKIQEEIEATTRQVTIGQLYGAEKHILDQDKT
ncbi:LYR motif-containing protein 4-like [Ciona intestinalis]